MCAMTESNIQREIQCSVDARARLWRLQVRNFLLADGRRVISGTPGMSDLQGLVSITVTQAHVGQTLAVYAAIEVKAPGGRTKPERLAAQQQFIATVRQLGGRAGFATSVNEAHRILYP